MSSTVIAVISAAVVALLVAGVGLYLIRRSEREPEQEEDLVSSASRLAEVNVSPFGVDEPLPDVPAEPTTEGPEEPGAPESLVPGSDEATVGEPGDEPVPEPESPPAPEPERVRDAEVIDGDAPVWAVGSQTDAPSPTPVGGPVSPLEPMFPPPRVRDPEPGPDREPERHTLFPPPPSEPEPEPLSHELEPEPEPEPEPLEATGPAPASVYDSDAVLRELRGEPVEPEPVEPEPLEPQAFETEPVEPQAFETEPLLVGAGPSSPPPPSWAPPGADGHPPKVLHRNTLPARLSVSVETEWFLLTPVEALGRWPASVPPPEPEEPPAEQRPRAAVFPQTTGSTKPPTAAPFRPAPPVSQEPPPPGRPVGPPAGGTVELPDSLLADLLGGADSPPPPAPGDTGDGEGGD